MSNEITFTPAAREAAKLKLAITGPSGSGKTTAALKCARGLVGKKGKIAVIDTENRSASLYSDITKFDVLNLEAPFEHGKFADAIKAAESAGYDCVIIDSASHLWESILEYKSQLDRRGGNSYTNWNEAGSKFREVIDCLLGSKMHVISCLRSKMEHTMEQDERGKTTIRKVGMAPIMRDGIEYEFTLVLDLDMSHQAVSSKDRTRMFDGKIFEITEKVGEQLAGWLKGSQSKREKKTKATPKKKAKATPEPVDEEVPLVDGGDLAKKIAAEDEPAVNGYLASLGWIKAGESFRNLSPAHIEKVLKKWNAFYAQVKAFTEGGAK